MSKVTMPERPDPDGFLAIRLAGHEVEVNAYRDSTLDAYAEAYAAAKVRESQEWQPIETAPKDGTEIIGWNGKFVTAISWLSDKDDNGHTGWCCSGYTDGGMLYYLHNALSDENQPTHWKPLPAPPTE